MVGWLAMDADRLGRAMCGASVLVQVQVVRKRQGCTKGFAKILSIIWASVLLASLLLVQARTAKEDTVAAA
jgi:hypothetical protein